MSRVWAYGPLLLSLSLTACKKHEAPAPPPVAPVVAVTPAVAPSDERLAKDDPSGHAPLQLCDPRGKDPLGAARDYYDDREYEKALSCAAEACAQNSDDPAAHSERAGALAALERFDEAKLAYARALALDPDLPD